MAVNDEIELISAMYQSKEFQLEESSSGNKKLVLNILGEKKHKLLFSCSISNQYPDQIPMVCILEPQLTKKDMKCLQSHLHSYLQQQNCIGQPMLLCLFDWVKEHIHDYYKFDKIEIGFTDDDYTYIVKLDHIRSRSRYIKYLKGFSKEFSVVCLLAFIQRNTFLLLRGADVSVKQFLLQQKSQKVDIDSSGQPCKEKMLTTLGKIDSSNVEKLSSHFIIADHLDFNKFKEYLDTIGYNDIFKMYILPVIDIKKIS